MPLQKLMLKSGVNRENTRLTNEGGWYEADKIRFRQGTPEVIGGWVQRSANTFIGVCRSLFQWVTLDGLKLIGCGTNLKFFLDRAGTFFDITPIRRTVTLGAAPFATVDASDIVTVTDVAHGAVENDFVTYSGADAVAGLTIDGYYQVYAVIDVDTYSISVGTPASATTTGGGAAVIASYEINTGYSTQVPSSGWGAGPWGAGPWGSDVFYAGLTLQLWSQAAYGEDLIFGPREGGIYYWDATAGVNVRARNLNAIGGTVAISVSSPALVTLSFPLSAGSAVVFSTTGALPTGLTAGTTYYVATVSGADVTVSATNGGIEINTTFAGSGTHSITLLDVPIYQQCLLVSDASRFVLAFGCNEIGTTEQDPMLIRWSDQENPLQWYPQITNQAGSLRLSIGSVIFFAIQVRQEILVWTDVAMYSLQYIGAPLVWGATLLDSNITTQRPNAGAVGSGVCYWMGQDKFYQYDGRVQTLNCDLRKYVFEDINTSQAMQTFATTNEAFNEIWWFYCSADSLQIDRYVVYNYLETLWYYGTMSRTAWIDAGLNQKPISATYDGLLLHQETGIDDVASGTPEPIHAYIVSSEFGIGDGDKFSFVWRMLPDLTFVGSDSTTHPEMTITLLPMKNSGSGYSVPPSLGGSNAQTVSRVGAYTVDQFTGQINIRVRARQMAMRLESNKVGTTWQAGAMRLDSKPDGRAG